MSGLSWKIKLISSISNFVMNLACRSDGTVNRRLSAFLDYKVPPSVKPINGVKTSDITVDQSRNLWFRLFTPINADADNSRMPVIVYFHGGGGVFLSADSSAFDTLCRRFAKELNAVIISVNYRLSPEHKYPCQYEDGFDVITFIDNNPNFEGFPTDGADLRNCFIGGDSAGGNIAHHVAVKACRREFTNLNIIGVIAIQPGFGGEERTESEIRLASGAPFLNVERIDWFWRAFLPEGSDRDHPAANVFGPNSGGDAISGFDFPATVVIVGGFDPLLDWQKRYCEGLKRCGKEAYLIEYPNAFHGFYSFPELRESCLFINEVRDFMQKQCEKLKE
ncbi:hypothetical protein CUMW_158030 [Citrus unshiu]|uniref:Alpha/beta hydrolase fold-3 domain-containing protein n=1 Tax=Citrus unshiu TaxID=55188 RepID=A0A2H5PQG4_CITUN|nr:hypothetical protein CUMW_158030 [Citrus unshiu]